MRQGFSYVQLLISIGILITALGLAANIVWPLVNKTLHNYQQTLELRSLSLLLDTLGEEAAWASQISAESNSLTLTLPEGEYTYYVNNQRLAKRKTGLIYLTPKEQYIRSFAVQPLGNQKWEITLIAPPHICTRVISHKL